MTPADTRSTVLLTRSQRLDLLASCVPLAIVLGLVGGYVVTALIGTVPHPPALIYAVLAAVLALVVYQAVQIIRDLASGVALVEEDLLINAWKASGPSSDFYAKFERLGTLSLKHRAEHLPSPRTRYLVTYSPASKTAWSLVPTGEAIV